MKALNLMGKKLIIHISYFFFLVSNVISSRENVEISYWIILVLVWDLLNSSIIKHFVI